MTSLINHSQSVRYSHSLLSTSYWQCHLHTSLSVFLSGFCCVCHLFPPLVSIFGLFPVLVSCRYELIYVQLCVCDYVLITLCILVLSFEFAFVWSTRYFPGVSCLWVLPCPALSYLDVSLKTIIWVYVLVCVFLFLPRVCTVTVLVSYLFIFLFFYFFRLLLHVNHVQPICTFLSCTVMPILIFKSTVYYHAHYFIFYILYFVLYIFFFFIHLILCILCVVFSIILHCPWSGPDSHFTAG